MLYSKVSCNVEESLNQLYNDGIYASTLDVDFNVVMTITTKGKGHIDGKKLYSDTYSEADVESILLGILQDQKKTLIGLDQTRLLRYHYLGARVDVIFSPVRYYENYYVYSVLGKRQSSWGEPEIGIIRFITKSSYENVLLNKRLMEERSYLKNIFNSVASYIVSFDTQLQIISVNKKISEALHLDENCIGKTIFEAFDQAPGALNSLVAEVAQKCRFVLNGIEIRNFESEIVFSDNGTNRKIYVNISVSPVWGDDNTITGVIVVANDISELKIYEKENELLRQYAALGETSADVAHDIKNPLLSIRSSAQLLKKQLLGGEVDDKYLNGIIESADRINQIIEQMLSFARISTEVETGYIQINSVLEECIRATTLNRTAKRITVRKFFAEDLPMLRISMLKLQQLFMNILLNAIQAIQQEGEISVITQADPNTKEAVIIIKDTGEGMEDVDAAFAMFYTTKVDGTGLGLSIVKKVIEELGGQYTVKSKPGDGTAFYIRLPYGGCNM